MAKIDFLIKDHRIYHEDENGTILAEITFPAEGEDNIVVINHTYVDESLRGQGIAGEMMRKLLEYIRKEDFKVVPTCSYAVVWFEKHSEDRDLLV